MMRCGENIGVIDKESKELYLMYSIDQSSFSKESLKEARKGKFIKE